jgi:hypothetical protein
MSRHICTRCLERGILDASAQVSTICCPFSAKFPNQAEAHT